MARKRALKQFSEKELLEEIARRHADKHYREGMTMSDMELAAEELKERGRQAVARGDALADEAGKPPRARSAASGSAKARDRERTVKSRGRPTGPRSRG
jgi:hypothetical protein